VRKISVFFVHSGSGSPVRSRVPGRLKKSWGKAKQRQTMLPLFVLITI
jgi:hypothetical protein